MDIDEAKRELAKLRNDTEFSGAAAVRRKIESLGWPHREVLFYRYVRAMTWKQISDLMGYSADHLRGYMNRRATKAYAESD